MKRQTIKQPREASTPTKQIHTYGQASLENFSRHIKFYDTFERMRSHACVYVGMSDCVERRKGKERKLKMNFE